MTISRPAPAYWVYLNGDYAPYMRPIEVSRNSGARPDTAVLEYHPGTTLDTHSTGVIQNKLLSAWARNEIAVEIVVERRDSEWEVIHWGKIVAVNVRRSEQGESVILTSRFDEHLWGVPVRGAYTEKSFPAKDELIAIDQDPVFNPIIKDRSWPNRSTDTYNPPSDTLARPQVYSGFVLPDQMDRDLMASDYTLSELNSAGLDWWDLSDCVEHLCYILNPNETYLRNPTNTEIETFFSTGNYIPRGIKIRRGKFLPDALATLLEPYGVNFFVRYDELGRRTLQFYRRNEDDETKRKYVRCQAYGTEVDADTDNVRSFDISMDVVNQATNKVTVAGAPEVIEITIELYPAWASAKDSTVHENLMKDCPAWDTDKTLSRVWRDWVANENNEYSEITHVQVHNMFSTDAIRRRRKLLPCITSNADGTPLGEVGHGISVEFKAGSADWMPITKIAKGVKVLSDEIGIRFDGEEVPSLPWREGRSNFRIRVTGCVEGDTPVEKSADETSTSLIADPREEYVIATNRYRWRYQQISSKYKSDVEAGTLNHTKVDDRSDQDNWTNWICDRWNQASVTGQLVLEGIDWQTTDIIGIPMAGIDGRNVSFLACHPLKSWVSYPTVVGVRYRFDTQETVILLDTYRRNPPRRRQGALLGVGGDW